MCVNDAKPLSDFGTIPEESSVAVDKETVFTSSGVTLTLPSEIPITNGAKILALLIFIASISGFAYGIDFVSMESGLVRPQEFIYSQTHNAPENSSILTGFVILEDGSPAENYSVDIRSKKSGNHFTTTDSSGYFEIRNITPDLINLDVMVKDGNITKGVSHRVVLSPPALFEPYGFTSLTITFPNEFRDIRADNPPVYWTDYSPDEMDFPLFDTSAGLVYHLIGVGFIGLSAISAFLALIGLRTGSPAVLRTASIIVFFTSGYYYTSCCLGIVTIGLSFVIPIRE